MKIGNSVNGGELGTLESILFDSKPLYSGKAELRQNLGRHQEKYCTRKPVTQVAEGSSKEALE